MDGHSRFDKYIKKYHEYDHADISYMISELEIVL